MGYSVIFNGVELSEYLNVLQGFTPFSGTDWSPELKSVNNMIRGSRFQYTTYKHKEIPMPFTMSGDMKGKYDALQSVLNVSEPKPLLFEGVPDRVFYAIPSGDLDFEDIVCFGSGTITWLVPDGVAHSITEKSATNNGTNTITLMNNGTEQVPINIRATMKSENGYMGFTLDDRFFQIGKPEEVDGKVFEESVKIFDDHLYEDKGWLKNQGITPPVTGERLQNGTVAYVHEQLVEGYVKTVDYGTGNSWHGAAVTKIVPTDVNGEYPVNWWSAWRFDFNTDGSTNKGREIGHNSITFSDENDNIIVSVVFEDNNSGLERSDMAIYIGNKRVWDTKNTTKFYVTAREGGPSVKVEKIGTQITVSFSYAGIKKTFRADNPNAQLRKVTWYGATYKTHTPIRNNLLRALQVGKHNVERYEDIPNYFSAGDEVFIDGSKNEVYINNLLDWDVVDIGSQVLLLPPGQHTLGIVTSSFSQIPDVEVTWKERYI